MLRCRITPAGAGKTPSALFVVLSFWDHPRRCGENNGQQGNFARSAGSPPQVRGKQAPASGAFRAAGITPAGAGKTFSPPSTFPNKQDHPRRCGENLTNSDLQPNMLGSPPQVRGKQLNINNCTSGYRITPAGAGKTTFWVDNANVGKDHPRRCGENPKKASLRREHVGSPPQVRGKPFLRLSQGLLYRITPAGAGKTWTAEYVTIFD